MKSFIVLFIRKSKHSLFKGKNVSRIIKFHERMYPPIHFSEAMYISSSANIWKKKFQWLATYTGSGLGCQTGSSCVNGWMSIRR